MQQLRMRLPAVHLTCEKGPTDAHVWLGADSSSYLLEQVSWIHHLLKLAYFSFFLSTSCTYAHTGSKVFDTKTETEHAHKDQSHYA